MRLRYGLSTELMVIFEERSYEIEERDLRYLQNSSLVAGLLAKIANTYSHNLTIYTIILKNFSFFKVMKPQGQIKDSHYKKIWTT